MPSPDAYATTRPRLLVGTGRLPISSTCLPPISPGPGKVWRSAVVGRTRSGPSTAQAVALYTRRAGSGWRRAPRLARPLAPGTGISVAYRGRVPCVAYEARPRGRVLICLVRGRWRDLPKRGLPDPPARLVKVAPWSSGLVAAFHQGHAASARFLVRRLAGGRWRPVGGPLSTGRSISVLGESSAGQRRLDIAAVDVASGRRPLWSFTRGRWAHRTPLDHIPGGPMPSGPVRLGARLYLAAVDASSEPWRLTVHALDGHNWSQLGDPLNRGAGNAQGVLRVSRREVWAAWQENRAPRRRPVRHARLRTEDGARHRCGPFRLGRSLDRTGQRRSGAGRRPTLGPLHAPGEHPPRAHRRREAPRRVAATLDHPPKRVRPLWEL